MPLIKIPRLNDVVTLATPWTFTLYQEYRNKTLFASLRLVPTLINGQPHPNPNQDDAWYSHKNAHREVTLPAGTQLTVRRIYVRNGKDEYASVTFSIPKTSPGKIRGKFWAKLDDVNRMEVE